MTVRLGGPAVKMGCGASTSQAAQTPTIERRETMEDRDTVESRETICVAGTPASPSDYTIVGLLGDGALGRVYLCDLPDGTSCALKVMSRADIDKRGIAAYLETEREILLRSVGHPFVAQMMATFSTETFEYMAMELGEGSLFDALYIAQLPAFRGRKGEAPHMSEEHARFYFSELCLGVKHIHSLGYAYRDMKLENCLVDRRGHVRVADFDQSAKLEDMASGKLKKQLVGTPEYMAPEIIRNLHEEVQMGKGVDVWAMGVLLFELIHGRTPFARRHQHWTNRDTYTEIIYAEPFEMGKLAVVSRVRQPRSNKVTERVTLRKLQIKSAGLTSLLQRMLTKNPEKRISLDEVCAHKWMGILDWDCVKSRMVEPPHRPDRSDLARQRSRRRSVTKMLESDSLARPNWHEHARTSLQGLKPKDILHHSTSREAVMALQEKEEGLQKPDCELQDPSCKFVASSNPVVERQKQLDEDSQALLASPMSQERRLTVTYEDERSDEEASLCSDSDTAESVNQGTPG